MTHMSRNTHRTGPNNTDVRRPVVTTGKPQAQVLDMSIGLAIDILGAIWALGVRPQVSNDGLDIRPAQMRERRHARVDPPVADGPRNKLVGCNA